MDSVFSGHFHAFFSLFSAHFQPPSVLNRGEEPFELANPATTTLSTFSTVVVLVTVYSGLKKAPSLA
jgi:hypothetical protein